MRKGSALYYLHGDHLGSISLTTDASGGIVAQSRYLPYGQERWTSGPAQTDFTFTGGRADTDSTDYTDYTEREPLTRVTRGVRICPACTALS